MARKITVEDLVGQGVPKDQAQRIVDKLTKPAPREIWWQFKATEEVAAKIVKSASAAGYAISLRKRFQSAAKEESKK
jgi:hypothetical protein